MNKLAPVPKTFQKPMTTAASAQQHQVKKHDIHAAKNHPAKELVKHDNQEQVGQEFSSMVAEQDIEQTQVPVEVKVEITDPTIGETGIDAALIENPILAGELATSKLSELSLSEAAKAIVSTETVVDTAQQVAANIVSPNIVPNDIVPNGIVEQIIGKTATPLASEKTSLEAVEVSADQQVAAKSVSKEPSAIEKTLQGLIEKFENLSSDDLAKIGLTPEQAGKIIGFVKNMLSEAGSLDLSPKAEKMLAELGALLDQTQNRDFNGVKDILQKIVATLGANNITDLAQLDDASFDMSTLFPTDKPEAKTGDKIQKADQPDAKQNDAALQNAANQTGAQVSKYAGRYDKTQNTETGGQSLSADADKTTSATHSQLTAAYNNVKSTTEMAVNNINKPSALDKISEKSPMDFLNQLQNNTANQSLDLNTQDNGVNVKLSMQNGKLSQNLPLNSMAFQMSKQFNKGNSEFQIRLDPAELGRINIKLTLKQGGGVKAHMVTERNDVFELLQRDSRALEQALNDAGFDGKDVEVEVSLDQNAQNGGTFAENFFDQAADEQNGTEPDNDNKPLDEEMVEMVASHIPLHVTSTAVDRSI
ncbi:MAG: flagellar hook-length control protein FliK [OCS116 cluster bacterium]|nr:flagellar hook-length control protein FliK [OCS116 cluster bacterium]